MARKSSKKSVAPAPQVEDRVLETNEGSIGYWTQTDDGPVWNHVEDQFFVGKVTLTDLEYRLLDWCAFNLYTTENGGEPQSASSVNVWFWPDEIATELGINEQGVGGVTSSLVKKGLVSVAPNEEPAGQPSSAGIAFTDEGFIAWQELYRQIGRPEPTEMDAHITHATDEEAAAILELTKPVADQGSAAEGFQYLTREELAALAAADPAARQAYRMARRKAARAARKARKSA